MQVRGKPLFLDPLHLHPTRFSLLGNKLGPILVQLPPTFGYHNLYALQGLLGFLRDSAQEMQFAIEFRNASLLQEDILSLLREHDIALCLNDLEWMPLSPEITTDFAYFRCLGHSSRNHCTTLGPRDLTQDFITWVGRVREVASQVDKVYGFFNDRYGMGYPLSDPRSTST